MYLHIGNDFVLNEQDIIGVFDFDHISESSSTMEYLKSLEDDDRLIAVSEELPKSFVLAVRDGVEIGYLSPLASRTIQHRKGLMF
ncbi:MAG: DUF370 domain-containing protein [Ruminococcaceae bacterium]|nr:DUF370 domain-containing protein [Oscillospiraceae bacterium]